MLWIYQCLFPPRWAEASASCCARSSACWRRREGGGGGPASFTGSWDKPVEDWRSPWVAGSAWVNGSKLGWKAGKHVTLLKAGWWVIKINKVKIYAAWLVLSWCLMVAHLPSQGMKMMSSDVWKLGRYSWGTARFMAEDPLSILKWWPLICQWICLFQFF